MGLPHVRRPLVDVEFATADWVDWYISRRLHGAIAPIEFETFHYEAFTREPAPAK